MPSIANPKLLIAGVIAFIVGWLLRGWASRNSLTDMAVDAAKSAAWASVKSRELPTVPKDVTDKITEVANAANNVERAKKVGGYAFRHFVAMVVGWAGLALLLGGLALAAAGIWWK